MNRTRIWIRLAPLAALALFSSCFQLLHIVELKADGSVAIRMRFSIPKQMLNMSRREGAAQQNSPDESATRFAQNLNQYRSFLSADPITRTFETETAKVVEAQLMAASLQNLSGVGEVADGLSILPQYNREQSMLIFHFRPQNKPPRPNRIETESEAPAAADPEAEVNDESMQKQQSQQIAQMLVGGAGYTLVLAGGLDARQAAFVCGQASTEIEIIPAASTQVITFPVFAHMLSNPDSDCQLRVQLKAGVAGQQSEAENHSIAFR